MLLGVLAGVVLAVSGSEPWFVPEGKAGGDDTLVAWAYTWDVGVVTSANALALVGLACWGVLLVTRGRFRRVIAWLGLLTAVGSLVTVLSAYLTTPDDVRAQFEELSIDPPAVVSTGWFWIGAVAAVVAPGRLGGRRPLRAALARDGPSLRPPGGRAVRGRSLEGAWTKDTTRPPRLIPRPSEPSLDHQEPACPRTTATPRPRGRPSSWAWSASSSAVSA